MTRNDFHAWRSWASATLVAIACAACGDETAHGGGLDVVVETDLAAPKDIDAIRFEVEQRGQVVRSEEVAIGLGHSLLPLHFRVGASQDRTAVTVRALGLKSSEMRIERHAVLPIPSGRAAVLHLPLNYLCARAVSGDDRSTCESPQTCAQGTCVDPSGELAIGVAPSVDGGAVASSIEGVTAAPDLISKAGTGQCFDVLGCFADFTAIAPDAETCMLDRPADDPSHLNVALALLPESEGVCNDAGCFVALDQGPGGFTVEGNQIRLPDAICREGASGVPRAVVISFNCSSKTSSTPPCGDWSSAQTPLGSGLATDLPSDAIGPACVGVSSERCGNCGVRTRSCDATTWSPWSACVGEGPCSPDTTRACGASGTQRCDARCSFGECMGQTCSGPTAEACGDCGTHSRTCDNGAWSAWSSCAGEGACPPNETRECGAQGSEVCGGACQWGACTHQVCAGAASEACGHCGTRSRICDETTATWSAWSDCAGEGECQPNDTRSCGQGGSQSCGGDCHWNAGCGGQHCDGALSQGCGHCGTQTRSCDSDTGETSSWSRCDGEGACAPGDVMRCGQGGMRVCGDDCRFSTTCDGQTCEGSATQSCGHCGTQTRRCDGTTGEWSGWSGCTGEGECAPGTTMSCSATAAALIVRTCDQSCHYGDCGCAAPRGMCGKLCVDLQTDAANCGKCSNACGEGSTCESGRCSCAAPLIDCYGSCVDPRTDSANCAACGQRCAAGLTCQNGQCTCPVGSITCGDRCVNPLADQTACGGCDIACRKGETCQRGLCTCPPGTIPGANGCGIGAR